MIWEEIAATNKSASTKAANGAGETTVANKLVAPNINNAGDTQQKTFGMHPLPMKATTIKAASNNK